MGGPLVQAIVQSEILLMETSRAESTTQIIEKGREAGREGGRDCKKE